MVKKYFEFEKHNTTFSREIIGGATTFITMVYIVVVNPKILEAAGLPFGASMVATILTAFFGTLIMGVYAKMPIAIAPYMGENAFIAYTVVKVMGYSWQTALGAIFVSGILFILITVLKIRGWLANSIPLSLKIGFSVGIGLFMTFIGLNNAGIVVLGVPGAPVHIGNLKNIGVILSILSFLMMSLMIIRRIPGAILISILLITLISFAIGVAPLPDRIFSVPPDFSEIFLKLDIAGALNFGFISVILTLFVMAFIDTIGTLIALGMKANLLNEKGELENIEKPMLSDAISTTLASLFGTTTSGAYIESATGIEAGARTGFANIVTAVLFLLCLFLAPLFSSVPSCAYSSALIVVGMLMLSPVVNLNFDDLTEVIPAFTVVALMCFTYNIGIGMTAGFVIYPLIKLFSGKIKEVSSGLWVLFAISAIFYVFYPY
ncbi:MAG: NCS2 family permease [Deltaproteobacteria bacterium]|nr:NCS2 family permease [Deltaproteobacteria bacterium]